MNQNRYFESKLTEKNDYEFTRQSNKKEYNIAAYYK